jgi:hypothetical protein
MTFDVDVVIGRIVAEKCDMEEALRMRDRLAAHLKNGERIFILERHEVTITEEAEEK